MGPSAFQFTNPVLLKMDMEINDHFSPDSAAEPETKFHVRVNRHPEKREAIVELTIEIGRAEDAFPFNIIATEGAKFRWTEEADAKLDSLLNQNAPALLLGYLRPVIASVTSASPFKAYNIPFIDFTRPDDPDKE